MKPFNLEAAQRGDPIVIRDGREAHFIAFVPEVKERSQVIFRVDKQVYSATQRGNGDLDYNSHLDLFMASKKRTVYVNIYPSGDAFHYNTLSQANIQGMPSRIGDQAWALEIEE